jgi:hypothetical protein
MAQPDLLLTSPTDTEVASHLPYCDGRHHTRRRFARLVVVVILGEHCWMSRRRSHALASTETGRRLHTRRQFALCVTVSLPWLSSSLRMCSRWSWLIVHVVTSHFLHTVIIRCLAQRRFALPSP